MRMLQKAGLDRYVQVVRDGGRALAHLTHHEARINDLIAVFLDLNIPTINGLQLLSKIRADDRLMNLSVIVMTSSTLPEDVQECRRLHVTSFVQKPLTLSTFVKATADIFHKPGDGNGNGPRIVL
jgi:CheY-like chemotaxis protein